MREKKDFLKGFIYSSNVQWGGSMTDPHNQWQYNEKHMTVFTFKHYGHDAGVAGFWGWQILIISKIMIILSPKKKPEERTGQNA